MDTVRDFTLGGSKITSDGVFNHEIKRCFLIGRKVMTKPDYIFKSRDISWITKGCLVKSMVFPVAIYGCELYCKESCAPNNWCFWTVVLEKTLESPLHCKGIQTVNPKGNQSWICIGRTDAEAETPILWKPHAKNRLIGEDTFAGKRWRQEVKGKTKGEMVGWHLEVMDMSLTRLREMVMNREARRAAWGHKEADTTKQRSWTDSWFTCLRHFHVYSSVILIYAHKCLFLYGFFSHRDYCRLLNQVPLGPCWLSIFHIVQILLFIC